MSDTTRNTVLSIYTSHPEGGSVDMGTIELLPGYVLAKQQLPGPKAEPLFTVHRVVEYAGADVVRWDDLGHNDKLVGAWDSMFYTVYGRDPEGKSIAVIDLPDQKQADNIAKTLNEITGDIPCS